MASSRGDATTAAEQSARGYFSAGGQRYAVPHQQAPKRGYKVKHSYDADAPHFQGETSTKAQQQRVVRLAESLRQGGHGAAGKLLEPYSPWAPRDRPRHYLQTPAGQRIKKHPWAPLALDVRQPAAQPPPAPLRSTNQAFSAGLRSAERQATTSLAGIAAGVAAREHAKQQGVAAKAAPRR